MPNLRNWKAAPLVIGGVLFLVCVLAAIWVGNVALSGESVPEFDHAVAMKMKQLGDASPAKGRWMARVTHLGDNWFLASVAGLGVLWYLYRRNWRLAAAWCAIAVGGQILNDGLKHWARRERPPLGWYDKAVTSPPTSKSFPSGHALGSTIIYGLLGYSLLLEAKRRSYMILVVAEVLLIVGTVSFSRIFLRVHFASDVIAGLLIGTAWLSLSLGLLESWRRATPRGEVLRTPRVNPEPTPSP